MKIPHPSLQKLGQRITISTVTQYAGKILQLGLSIISLNLISNFLSDAGYSYYGAVTELALFFSVVGNLGIFGNTVRAMSDKPQDGKLFTQALILRILTAGSIFLISIFSLAITTNDQVFLLGSILFLGALFFPLVTNHLRHHSPRQYFHSRAKFLFRPTKNPTQLVMAKIHPPKTPSSQFAFWNYQHHQQPIFPLPP